MAEDLVGEVTARVEDAAAALEELQALLREEEYLDKVLARLADTAVRTIGGAAAVSVTVVSGESGQDARTAAATDESVVRIDEDQYASGAGPCLEAALERHTVRVSVRDVGDRWAAFTRSAEEAGMLAHLSVPLQLDDREQALGALNVYGARGGCVRLAGRGAPRSVHRGGVGGDRQRPPLPAGPGAGRESGRCARVANGDRSGQGTAHGTAPRVGSGGVRVTEEPIPAHQYQAP